MGYGSINGSASTPSFSGLAADAQSLGNLKLEAGKSTPAAIKETAKQFESLFMRELIKSMREATVKSGMMDSPGGDLGTDLLDQQFAVQMSGQPGGLSDLIAQQLTRQMGVAPVVTPAAKAGASTSDEANSGTAPVALKMSPELPRTVVKTTRTPTETQANFVRQHAAVAAKI